MKSKNSEPIVLFDDISERDMDMLFLDELVSSMDFLEIFTNKIGIHASRIISAQISKMDIVLGESDLTVIVESDGKKVGLLIEDKIDAIAMPDQAERYISRGEKGIRQNDYDEYYVFIVAPIKYLSSNSEAAKYPNQITYESILKYFERKTDGRSLFKAAQVGFAINKQKTGYDPIEDPRVTEFWKRYYQYQKRYYPGLYLLYDGKKKGTRSGWPRFNTIIDRLYIVHKSNFGRIDLTFDGCGNRLLEIEDMISTVCPDYLKEGYTIQKIGKAAAVRLEVPIVDFHNSFDEQISAIKECFNAVGKVNAFAKELDIDSIYKLLE